MKVLFWNINNNEDALNLLLSEKIYYNFSIIGFSEYWNIIHKFHEIDSYYKLWFDPIHKRTALIHSDGLNMKFLGVRKYFSYFNFIYNELELIIFILHCKSQKNGYLHASRISQATQIEINEIIKKYSTEYVLIMGDFNLPHHDELFLNALQFNCMNYYINNECSYKSLEGVKYLKFYNPISALSGDISKGPSGTYYYNIPTSSQSWHTFDQILISHPLSKYLDFGKIEILSNLCNTELLNKNSRPNKKYSDHLPVKVEFI